MTDPRTAPEQDQHLPERNGPRPVTIGPNPHAQRSQHAPAAQQNELLARATALPDVRTGPSGVSVPGARAFHLIDGAPTGPAEAFQGRAGREFAHLHPPSDGSLHMTLPAALRDEALARGWAEPHPVSGTPLIYGPRDADELEVVWLLLHASWMFATGRRT